MELPSRAPRLLRDQVKHLLGDFGQLLLAIEATAPGDPDELDEVHAALAGLDPADEALFTPDPFGQLPLR